MQKVIRTFSFTIIFLFLLSIFGWMAHHITKGDKNFGAITGIVKFMYQFPDLFEQSVEEVKTLPRTYVKTYEKFKPVNKLDSDLIVLVTYSDTGKSRSIVLMNLLNDSILYKWRVHNPFKEHNRIMHPLLFPDKQIVFSFDRKPLYRIDSLSRIIWKQEDVWSHHSLELDADGNIWACTEDPTYQATGLFSISDKKVYYRDNSITKLDPETGEILFTKSVTDIYRENDMLNYLLKSESQTDPIHLNDIQPALKTTKYYKKNDLFLSIRQASLVVQYRPSTNKVIRTIEGPYANQHDVDFLGDSSIIIFNNNFYTAVRHTSWPEPTEPGYLSVGGDLWSHIVQYNFEDGSFSFIGDSIFRANDIFSRSESLQEFISPETYFVEEQNSSILWIIRNNEVIYKNIIKSPYEGYHHLSNWTRIIKNYE